MDKRKEQVTDRINLLLDVLQRTMKTTNVMIGFDLKEKKLILMEKETKCFVRVDLGDLNNLLEEK